MINDLFIDLKEDPGETHDDDNDGDDDDSKSPMNGSKRIPFRVKSARKATSYKSFMSNKKRKSAPAVHLAKHKTVKKE